MGAQADERQKGNQRQKNQPPFQSLSYKACWPVQIKKRAKERTGSKPVSTLEDEQKQLKEWGAKKIKKI